MSDNTMLYLAFRTALISALVFTAMVSDGPQGYDFIDAISQALVGTTK